MFEHYFSQHRAALISTILMAKNDGFELYTVICWVKAHTWVKIHPLFEKISDVFLKPISQFNPLPKFKSLGFNPANYGIYTCYK